VLVARLDDGRVIAAVADGMGGLEAGGEASRRALEAIETGVRAGVGLEVSVHRAHQAVRQLAEHDEAGSTVVAALIDEHGVEVAHVGDSRAYQLGPMGLVPLTTDHTVASEAAVQGELAGREVADSRWGRALSRSLGREGSFEVTTTMGTPVSAGGALILTSDGVHGVLGAEEMERIAADASDAGAAATALVEHALAQGATDNVSAVVVARATPTTSAAAEAAREPLRRAAEEQKASGEEGRLVHGSGHARRRRSWPGQRILAGLVVVALVSLVLYLLLA
jgi:protein phosphatase